MRGFLYRMLVPALRRFNAGGRGAVLLLHLLQFKLEGFLRGDSEWFDHQLDVYWQWPARRRASFLERGVLSALAIGKGARVLELCCGDGFNAARFYAPRAASVTGVDANAEALQFARRTNRAPNLSFVQGDIRTGLPPGPFDNVVWDAALTHFPLTELQEILGRIRGVLAPGGVLSGQTDYDAGVDYSYALVSLPDAGKLADLLGEAFPHVYILQTREDKRTNYYFFCSERREALPFLAEHDNVLLRSAEDLVAAGPHAGAGANP